jgi:endoglycosylceramidase
MLFSVHHCLSALHISCLLAFTILGATQSYASGLIRVEGSNFKDQSGRIVLLRGINLSNSAKFEPFDPLPDLNHLSLLKKFGINNIRLLFIWEAFEPEKGQYQFDYLERLGKIVHAAAERGISTVVDFHADGFSRYVLGGCGSGFPKWTIPPSLFPSAPVNDEGCKTWASLALWDFIVRGNLWTMAADFFSDTHGARTQFLLAWKEIARFFKNYPTVIGYDLMNEPWADEITQLMPLYNDIEKVIRKEDPEAVLFVEPSVFALNPLLWESQLPKPAFSNFAYAPHSYDLTVLSLESWYTGNALLELTLQQISKKRAAWNVPVYIGEYGPPGEGNNLGEYVDLNYKLNDHYAFSGAQWNLAPSWNPDKKDGFNQENFSIIDSQGNPRANFKPRPYPQAIAGILIGFKVEYPKNPSQRSITVEWIHDPALGQTIIAFPADYFIPKLDLHVEPFDSNSTCELDPARTIVTCRSDKTGWIRVKLSGQQK